MSARSSDAAAQARDAREASSTRDARGRFQPGRSGNPAGKKPGTLNHATRWAHLLRDDDFDTVAGHIIALARKGEFRAIRFLLDRIDPKPRGRAITLDVAPGASVLERFAVLFEALAAGEITPDEARTVALSLDLEGRQVARVAAGAATAPRQTRGDTAVRPAKPAPAPADDPDSARVAKAVPVRGATPGASLHSASKSPSRAAPAADPARDPAVTSGGGSSPLDLHSACISGLPTLGGRSVDRPAAA